MSADLVIDGATYISSKRASEISGYSQDYVGQLARAGKIAGKRIGGLWYVLAESISGHKQIAEAYVPAQPIKPEAMIPAEDASMVTFEGKTYVSAARAAKLTSYHQDYIGQLARGGKILSRQVGRRWYVDIQALKDHKTEKDSLLAAVQAASVGVLKTKEEKTNLQPQRSLADEVGLHYSYRNDARPLSPVIREHEPVQTISEDVDSGRTHIPINVSQIRILNDKSRAEPKKVERKSVRIPRISIFLNVLYASVILSTIIVAFNLNVVELPSVVKKSGSLTSGYESMMEVKGVAAGIKHIRAIQQQFKLVISTEVTYTRGE